MTQISEISRSGWMGLQVWAFLLLLFFFFFFFGGGGFPYGALIVIEALSKVLPRISDTLQANLTVGIHLIVVVCDNETGGLSQIS